MRHGDVLTALNGLLVLGKHYREEVERNAADNSDRYMYRSNPDIYACSVALETIAAMRSELGRQAMMATDRWPDEAYQVEQKIATTRLQKQHDSVLKHTFSIFPWIADDGEPQWAWVWNSKTGFALTLDDAHLEVRNRIKALKAAANR